MVRVFKNDADVIKIAGEEFPLKALPSGKTLNFMEMYGDLGISGLVNTIGNSIDAEDSPTEEVKKIFEGIFNVRYDAIAYGLNITDEVTLARLKKAIDDAPIKELVWVVGEILEINGAKKVERLLKSLMGNLMELLPEKKEIGPLLQKYFNQSNLKEAINQMSEKYLSTGSTTSSSVSEENPSTSPQDTSSTN